MAKPLCHIFLFSFLVTSGSGVNLDPLYSILYPVFVFSFSIHHIMVQIPWYKYHFSYKYHFCYCPTHIGWETCHFPSPGLLVCLTAMVASTWASGCCGHLAVAQRTEKFLGLYTLQPSPELMTIWSSNMNIAALLLLRGTTLSMIYTFSRALLSAQKSSFGIAHLPSFLLS